MVLPPTLNPPCVNKNSMESDDNMPLSWKTSNKRSSSLFKALSVSTKATRTESSSRNIVREALDKSKKNTTGRIMPKKFGINIVEPDDKDTDSEDSEIEWMFEGLSDLRMSPSTLMLKNMQLL